MGEIVTLNLPRRARHLSVVQAAPADDTLAATQAHWTMRQLTEAMASLAIAGADIAEAQKMFHQQRTDPRVMVSAETIESIVLALIPTIHLAGMSNRDRALYAALQHWLTSHQGGDDVA